MSRFPSIFALACCLLCASVGAEQLPAKGKLLVATEDVVGSSFARTVILLLHHDESGSFGLVINRPIDVSAMASLQLLEDYAEFRDSFYWGGPVSTRTMRALMRTDAPPEDAEKILDSVYLVDIDAALLANAADSETLRFFAGYAGWTAGQLQYELALNSWRVVPATEALVFAKEPAKIWRLLLRAQEYRVAVPRTDHLLAWLRVDPFLEPLRSDPRFAAIAADLKLPSDSQ